MLLAYIDEIGETGAFVSRDHRRFNTSPAFGYAGFIIPEESARKFGAIFVRERNIRFVHKAQEKGDGRWEVKGSEFFMKNTPVNRPENLRIFSGLIRSLSDMGGKLFYYADEKPLGTAKQTSFNSELGAQRERDAMQETLNRIARHADYHECNVQVMIDTVNENQRRDRVAKMYQHIFDRSSSFREMRRIIEPPMHIDSILSSNIQFSDWVAAYLSRAIDRQLIEDSTFMWVGEHPSHFDVAGSFTHESKLHLYHKDVQDLNHSEVVYSERPLWDHADNAVSVGSRVGPAVFRRIHSAAVRANHNR